MSSITHSASSLLSSFESLVAGLTEAVLATLRHVFDLVIGVLRGVVHISEEVVGDTWAIIEGIVKAVFANIIPLALLAFGAVVGIAVATKKSTTGPGASSTAKGKGKAKRA